MQTLKTVDRVRERIGHVNYEPARLPTARPKSDIFRSTSSLRKDFKACFESHRTVKLGNHRDKIDNIGIP